jgi:hypothetical protein
MNRKQKKERIKRMNTAKREIKDLQVLAQRRGLSVLALKARLASEARSRPETPAEAW